MRTVLVLSSAPTGTLTVTEAERVAGGALEAVALTGIDYRGIWLTNVGGA